MSKKDEAKHRARHTLEFKLDAVRLVKAGQEASVTARVLGILNLTVSQKQLFADSAAAWALTEAGDQCVAQA